MKKFLLVLIAAAVAVGANAQRYGYGASTQKIKFGAKAGLNLAQISAGTTKVDMPGGTEEITEDASDMILAFFVSAHVNIPFGEFFGLQPEVSFSMQGGEQTVQIPGVSGNIKNKLNLNYINVPVLFEVKPITDFSIFVGPQIGLNIYRGTTVSMGDQSISVSGKDFDDGLKEQGMKLNTLDVAAVVGLQYAIMGKILISARYNLGFTPTMSSDVSGMTLSGNNNRVIQFGVGYQF